MGFMVVRAEETKKIFLDEIAVLLIENPAVSLTGCLLEALVEKKIRVIFCDARRTPNAELVPYYNSYDCSRKIKAQMAWTDDLKGAVWADIVAEKIRKQADFLEELERFNESSLLRSYLSQIEPHDATNREGHAAKVYFNALFGMDFTRSEENTVNAALNYGYSIILSAFNREVVAHGYLTQLGIFHNNMFNHFNLSCDLMEPFRVVVDRTATTLGEGDKDFKKKMANVLNYKTLIDGKNTTLDLAIRQYARSVFHALENQDKSLLIFPEKITQDEL